MKLQKIVHFLLVVYLLNTGMSFAHHSDVPFLYSVLSDPGYTSKQRDIVKHLATKPYLEVQFALFDLFAEEAMKPYDVADYLLMREILMTLEKVGTAEHLEEFQLLYSQAKLRGEDYSAWETLHIDQIYRQMIHAASERESLPSLVTNPKLDSLELLDLLELRGDKEKLSLPLGKSAKAIQEFLSERLVGQPHVVEKIADIIVQDKALEVRQTPEVLYLMGQPGTGKDTAAMAMTDAIHNEDGAWQRHMFEVSSLKSHSDLWGVLGSTTGHVGSDEIPPFISFLVEHSGGRYLLEEEQTMRGSEYRIVENPDWKGQDLPGFNKPSEAVVYLNEFHDWSKDVKNLFIKRALEKGTVPINNPNGGVAEIRVPVTYVMASNEGIGLVSSRDHLGRRHGKPLSFDKSITLWEKNHDNVSELKEELKKTGLTDDGHNPKGNSEELISRIPDDRLMLMKPLSPDEVRFIAQIKLQSFRKRISTSNGRFRQVHLRWDDTLLEFLQTYEYSAEDGARPIQSKVASLIESTFFDAAKAGKIPAYKEAHVELSAHKVDDGTWRLKFEVEEINEDGKAKKAKSFSMPIKETLKNMAPTPLADDEIDELIDMPSRMKKKLFGAEDVIERVSEALLMSEERRRAGRNVEQAKKGARSFMFLGPSSTGKTELAKVIAEEVLGTREDLAILDFNGVQSKQQVHEMIYGKKNGRGMPEASEFMMEYDRRNGKVIVLLDEIANVGDPEALVPLYQLLDEPLVPFADGKERNMSDVIIIMTGNAGEEWYQNIPADIPDTVQRMARDEIYEAKTQNYKEGRKILEKYFREAFINRVGDANIFFFPSLSYKAQRELINLKMKLMMEDLAPTSSGIPRGWNLKFLNSDNYKLFVESIENDAFNVKEQGRAIDRYVNTVLGQRLRRSLLEAKFSNDADIVLTFKGADESLTDANDPEVKTFVVTATDAKTNQSVDIKIPGRGFEDEMLEMEVSKLITAFHEAGHAVVGHTFFSNYEDPQMVKIIPGVTEIAGEMVYYAGVAGAVRKADAQMTRERIVREIAKLAGGYMAEKIITVGERHSAGKSNDMQRATKIADRAILEWGLSDKWGYELAPEGGNLEAFKEGLPEEAKVLLRKERQRFLEEGEKLAKRAILINFEVFVDMANQLAEAGELKRTQMKTIFEAKSFVPEHKWGSLKVLKSIIGIQAIKAKWNEYVGKYKNKHVEVTVRTDLKRPDKIANIEEILKERRALEVSTVDNYNLVPTADKAPNAPKPTCKQDLADLLK